MKSFTAFWLEKFEELHIQKLNKRHVILADVEALLPDLSPEIQVSVIGYSAENKPIYKLQVGTGPKTVLAWAAMRGNESTALRGWLDLLINLEHSEVQMFLKPLLEQFTIHFIPMLNPDGAQRYSRRNAMDIDMNRDARALQTPEMKLLVSVIEELKPVLAFNLHDQRNIFAVAGKPATISFLAPAFDLPRSLNLARETAMDLIGMATNALEPLLSGQIGRYTDEYYPTAIGEFVQQRGIPTILVECGAAQNDPLRQQARKANPIILHAVLERFTTITASDTSIYTQIPVNETNQVDILIKGIDMTICGKKVVADLALLAEESILDGSYTQTLKVLDFGDLRQLIGLETYQWRATQTLESVKIGAVAEIEIETDAGILKITKGLKFS